MNKLSVRHVISFVTLIAFAVLIIAFWRDGNSFEFILFIFGLFTLPIFCFNIVSFVVSLFKWKNIYDKFVIYATLSVVLLYYLMPDYHVNTEIMEKYYSKHKNELWQLADYAKSLNTGKLYIRLDAESRNDSLSDLEYENIVEQLKDLGCISIHLNYDDNEDVRRTKGVDIGFRYSGFALYSYLLLNPDVSEVDKKEYADDYDKLMYCDSVVFVYSCGAVGSCSYPNKDKYLELYKSKK